MAMVELLKGWGLEALAPAVLNFLQDGYTQDQVSILIQDTPEYKQRFQGNELRRAKGLPVLSPRDYLSVESSYKQIMSTAGLPVGFYDDPSDFADWIGKDVAPQEVSERVGYAVDAAQRVDPATVDTFQQWYGIGTNDLAAFFLDQERALPQIQRIAKGARIGAAGKREGLDMERERAEQLGFLAGTRDVEGLVSDVAEATSGGRRLSAIHGGADYGQADAEREVFENSNEARRRRQRLQGMETSAFAGTGAIGRNTLEKDRQI
jgi:hypothetical protein